MDLPIDADQDPRNWSIEQVVRELCTNATPCWSPRDQSQLIPDRHVLEDALRRNHVDGDTLLALDMPSLKDDIGITSFGQRRAIMRAIEILRTRSPSYQQMAFQADSIARMQSAAFATPQITHSRTSFQPQSPAYFGLSLLNSGESRQPTHSPTLNNTLDQQPVARPEPPSFTSHGVQPPPTMVNVGPDTQTQGNSGDTRSPRPLALTALPPPAEESGTSAAGPAKADTKSLPILSNRPRKEYTIVNGKKKITPTFVSHLPEESQPESTADSYLASYAIPLQDVFYLKIDTDFGETFYRVPSDESDDFVISGSYPTGQRKSVARLVQRSLRYGTTLLARSGLRIKLPYSASQIHENYSEHLCTLFSHGDGRAQVHNVQDFPELVSMQPRPGKFGRRPKSITQAAIVDGHEINGAQQESSEWDYLADKYPDEGSEDALPLYGDSGDEGDLDEDTWREIQEEQAEIAEKQRQQIYLTSAEVESTINEAIDEMRQSWRDTKMAKIQRKAFYLWKKASRSGNRQQKREEMNAWKARYTQMITKIKLTLAKDLWRNASELKKQCQSLEQAVSNHEEYDYYSQILSSDQTPHCPPREVGARKRPLNRQEPLEEGEEIIESESEDPLESDDEDAVLDTSSDAGSIHHDPEIAVEASVPVDTTSTPTQDPAHERRTPSVLGDTQKVPDATIDVTLSDAPASDADIDSDSSDDVVTSVRSKKKQTRPCDSPIKIKLSPGTPTPKRSSKGARKLEWPKASNSEDSDLDGPPRLPPTKYRDRGRTSLLPVDLTLSSPSHHSSSDFSVHTPELNPTQNVTPTKKRGKQLNLLVSPDNSGLPAVEDIQGIRDTPWTTIESIDKRRALAKAVYSLEQDVLKPLVAFLQSHDTLDERTEITISGLVALTADNVSIDGVKEKYQQTARVLTLLYVTYVCGQNALDYSKLSEANRDLAFQEKDDALGPFYDLLDRLLKVVQKYVAERGLRQSNKRKRDGEQSSSLEALEDTDIQTTDYTSADLGDQLNPPPSHKKRKRKVKESQEAMSLQYSDKIRIQQQEMRRKQLLERLGKMQAGESPLQLVNTTDPSVYLDPHIANRVKPHQMNGIQFLWREVIEDPKYQGCILAHTMGLGKTMQVISLLVTIAQCNQSRDAATRKLIPAHLRHNKTLILCPKALLDNWEDELLMWTPQNAILGAIHKCNSLKRAENISIIESWSVNGGVIIMSYERFRALISMSQKQKDEGSTTAPDMQKILLEEPQLVVADEAHTLKNATSKINQYAKLFKTTSRIALTGSPLSNHLEEYHTMVDWIAPNYLGDIVQFRSKYSEPIMEGLYVDSSAVERRLSLRRLHVLKRDLDPKINRADISAIAKDMPTKTEFFITIPLTEQQKQAYDIYVASMLASLRGGSGNSRTGRILGWIPTLSWLCHHPACFLAKLEDREMEAPNETKTQNRGADANDSPDEAAVLAELSVDSQLDVEGDLGEAMRKVKEIFASLEDGQDLFDPALSYRTVAVKLIVEKAVHAGDKTLIFSHSIPTLNYLERMLTDMGCSFCRIDGQTDTSTRQAYTKEFNQKNTYQVFLISIRAGGLGLNLQGASRVIIFDFSFNPTWEQQAIGRAYRLNQKRPVFVYRFQSGGTFEDVRFNKSVFKTQLFGRVVDKKNLRRHASKSTTDYLFPVKDVAQQDFSEALGKDPKVLDAIIHDLPFVRSIVLTETFQKEDDEQLNDEEQKAAEEEYRDQRLQREDPRAWAAKQAALLKPRQYPMGPSFPSSSMPNVNGHAAPSPFGRPALHTPSRSQYSFVAPPFGRHDLNAAPSSQPLAQPRNRPQTVVDDTFRDFGALMAQHGYPGPTSGADRDVQMS